MRQKCYDVTNDLSHDDVDCVVQHDVRSAVKSRGLQVHDDDTTAGLLGK